MSGSVWILRGHTSACSYSSDGQCGVLGNVLTLKSDSWVQTLAVPLACCVPLGKWLNLSGLSFPICKLGTNITCLTRIRYIFN